MEINKSTKKTTFIFLVFTIILTFLFYYQTLFYGIKAYDELAIFKELHVPTCFNLSEIFELISKLGLKQHFESSNILYSNISSLRCDPFCAFLHIITQFIFQKNVFYYHLYGLTLHLINTAFIFLILNKVSVYFAGNINNRIRLFFILILTILWSTHPVNIESVLLATNANITLSYSLALFTFYLYLFIFLDEKKWGFFQRFCLFTIFLFALLIAEFHFMLPIILLSYSIAFRNKREESLKNNFQISLISVSPIIFASMIYIVLFLLSYTKVNIHNQISLNILLERVFWLSPQILFHFFKLLILPIKLSIDQTLLVHLADSLFSPYAIFCFGVILTLLILSIISLFNTKKRIPLFFLIFFPFLLSLLPYSQLLAPIYNLASERYLYLPSFLLILGVSVFIFKTLSQYNNKKITAACLIILVSIQLTYSIRGYIRTIDWKDNISLYTAAIKATENPLFKAYRYRGLIPQNKLLSQYPEREVDLTSQKLAVENLQKAISLYKDKIKNDNGNTPEIIKVYGLDSKTLLAKAVFILAQSDFSLNSNPKSALEIISPYINDLLTYDASAIAFYASLLYYNKMPYRAIEVLQNGYKVKPYSTRIILSLCDLTYIYTGDLKTIENYILIAFKYFPYDSYVTYALANTYRLMNNHEKYAYYSYIYGLRNHSLEALQTAKAEYLFLNNISMVEKVTNKIQFIEKELQKRV